MRILFALPGLHRYDRGAEIAFISIATELAKLGDQVTLMGSGRQRASVPYHFFHAASMPRERFEGWPSVPLLRGETAYEELTFLPGLLRHYDPAAYDVTITCSYPFTNWALRRPAFRGRPPHVYVTQNGDWPTQATNAEFRFFGCEGLVCTNPEYYTRNKDRWRCVLIPNGVDCTRFFPGPAQRQKLGLPTDRLIVLMVSALIPSKRVDIGVEVISHVPGAHLVVAGDGPMRSAVDAAAARLLPGRFTRLSVTPEKMPLLYRSADVFMHLSLDEPSSLAFVEALACGLPVVAHDSPRMRYIAGEDAFLLNADDPKAIAQQVALASKSEATLAQKRAERAATFSWPNMAARYRQFLQEIVSSAN